MGFNKLFGLLRNVAFSGSIGFSKRQAFSKRAAFNKPIGFQQALGLQPPDWPGKHQFAFSKQIGLEQTAWLSANMWPSIPGNPGPSATRLAWITPIHLEQTDWPPANRLAFSKPSGLLRRCGLQRINGFPADTELQQTQAP